MILYTGHGGGGSALSFTPGNISGTRVEMKVCELCAGMFVREMGMRTATCGRCIAAAERRRAKEARELLVARTADGRYTARSDATKMMPAQ
jgi:hypothetical protein